MLDTILSLALGEEEGREALLQSISARIREIHAIYPRLPLDEEKAVQFVSNLVGDTQEFSGTFLEFLFKGTRGFVAELALALIALSFLYAHGSSFLKGAMRIGGFEKSEVHGWLELHRKITLRLLNDTVLTSLIRGVALALVAHFIGGFFFLPVFFLGAFIGLVPVVGSAMVWLPLSSLVWTRGEPVTAMAMAGLSLFFNYLISRIRARMGRRLHEQGAWLSFMLFLGIIGGILILRSAGFYNWPNGSNSCLWARTFSWRTNQIRSPRPSRHRKSAHFPHKCAQSLMNAQVDWIYLISVMILNVFNTTVSAQS